MFINRSKHGINRFLLPYTSAYTGCSGHAIVCMHVCAGWMCVLDQLDAPPAAPPRNLCCNASHLYTRTRRVSGMGSCVLFQTVALGKSAAVICKLIHKHQKQEGSVGYPLAILETSHRNGANAFCSIAITEQESTSNFDKRFYTETSYLSTWRVRDLHYNFSRSTRVHCRTKHML